MTTVWGEWGIMAAPGMIDSGRIISRGFGALGKNFPAFFGAALLLTGLPAFALQYLLVSQFFADSAFDSNVTAYGVGWLISWILGAFLQGILVRATVLHLAGQSAEIGQSILTALRLFLPIVAISFLVFLCAILGLILLIVPGVMFYIAMIVAIPALIEEKAGVFGSMGRSFRLTRGSWLPIFALSVIYVMFAVSVATLFSLVFGVRNFGMGYNDPMLAAAVSALTTTVTSMVAGAMIASLYIELRSVKEGATTDDLASIFA